MLDVLDRKMLQALDCGASLSFSALARRLRVGSDIVAYRYRRLEDAGIIRSASAIVDPGTFGLSIVKTYLRLSDNERGRKKLIEQVSASASPCWVAEVIGGWDLVLSVYSRTPRDFERSFRELLGKHLAAILEMKVFHLVEQWKFSRTFGRTEKRDVVYLGKDGQNAAPDGFEEQLLVELGKNARRSYVDLGSALKKTPQVVRYRIAQLENSGVIAGYVMNLDLAKLGLLRFKTAVHTRGWRKDEEEDLLSFLRGRPEVTVIIRQIGPWQLEFDAECEDLGAFQKLLNLLRDRFPGYVDHLEHVVYQDDFSFRTPGGISVLRS